MNKLRTLSILLFVVSCSIICGCLYASTKIYYWCVSPDCFSIWMTIMGFVIKIGQTP